MKGVINKDKVQRAFNTFIITDEVMYNKYDSWSFW